MKTDLAILIDHLQKEVDYLNSSIDQCIAEEDYDGAKAFQAPLVYTRRKLNVLKCLQNPNFNRIEHLTRIISRMEKELSDGKFEIGYIDEQTRQQLENHLKASTQNEIAKSKIELNQLQSIPLKQGIDDDKVLELLELLEKDKISQIEFEIKKGELYLMLQVNEQEGVLTFKTAERANLAHYLTKPAKSTLRQLGFNLTTFSKHIPNIKESDKLHLLEELAIIYFEVFGIFGEELKMKMDER